jgi:hypothetical protein
MQQSLSATGVNVLHLENVAGKARIEAWNQSTIRIDARKNAPDVGALRGIHIAIASDRGVVDISTHYDESAAGVSHGGVDYTIMAPAAVALRISNIAGTTTVGGFTGDVSVKAQAGTVDAMMARVSGNHTIDLSATTGTVTLSIPERSDATVSAHSTVGSFKSDFATVSGSRENVVGSGAGGKIGDGSAQITLNTTTGTIELRASH